MNTIPMVALLLLLGTAGGVQAAHSSSPPAATMPIAATPTLPPDLAAPRRDHAQTFAARKRRAPKPATAAPAPVAPTAQRFDMTQGGKRMSADDFEAWMKARGIRVATGKPKAPVRPAR